MKTEFAEEKSAYAQAILKAINRKLDPSTRLGAIIRLEELEQKVKEQDDELIFIVTTRKTNPLVEGKTCAPPMDS